MSGSRMRRSTGVVLAALAVATVAVMARAGDLSPPPGPITPTMKSLADVEPRIPVGPQTTPGDAGHLFRIVQPGSYYLTGNVAAEPNKHGIEIAASGVTLDLMGFAVVGDGSISRNGIHVLPGGDVTGLTVRNGVVRGWGSSGVDLDLAAGTKRIERIIASDNGLMGIDAGEHATVRACVARNNALTGILALDGSVVESCIVAGNAANGGVGLNVAGATVTSCTAVSNHTTGITANRSTILSCVALSNGFAGLSATDGSTVKACAATSNVGAGITGQNHTTIIHCAVSLNQGDGISISSGCYVLSNNADRNGFDPGDGAGIHVTSAGAGCRIEGNNVTRNDRGLDVDSAGNLIVRNSAHGNTTNFSIIAGNTVGPTVTAAAIPTNDKPHANYDY